MPNSKAKNDASKAWARRNPDKVYAAHRRWLAKHPTYYKDWLAKHPNYRKDWLAAHPNYYFAGRYKK